ncbi:copper homeostasis protein [Neolewinella xylanilytica]|uniref:PF03932 family protein CutC n=1 Tax=Neolewinella xylanilytica TaxID=1514080 RepID=A0A2S6I6H2_9BACT|nr:copper homeostasis protein CutC [Neolewinella xylanilytica]PPK86701.1 copper homeostasis protein [Neolewinella xylanilytica]
MSKPIFEVCLGGVDDVVAAKEGGADRVELCAALVEGGLTPSWGTISAAATVGIDMMVMIRPRGGDFDYSQREFVSMEDDIIRCRDLGVRGVVIGLLDTDGTIAVDRVRRLLRAAAPLEVTFHRAFDVCRDPHLAMRQLADLGVSRILTSGQQATVPEGTELIRQLIETAPAGMTIMPGCGITAENLGTVLQATGATEFHATAFRREESRMQHRNDRVYMGIPGLPEYEREATSAEEVRKFVAVSRQFDRSPLR